MYIPRKCEGEIAQSLSYNPVTAIIGPRQCGKSTLVKHLLKNRKNVVLLD